MTTDSTETTPAFKKKRSSCPSARCVMHEGTIYLGSMFQAYRCGECFGVYSKALLKKNTEPAVPGVPTLEVDIGS